MGTGQDAGQPTSRRYSEEEKAAAVRMVRALRAETVKRVADQLGYGAESVRMCGQAGRDRRRRDPWREHRGVRAGQGAGT